jgi:DNA repair protein RadC
MCGALLVGLVDSRLGCAAGGADNWAMSARSIKHWPANERPRERLAQAGAKHLSDAELLAILLCRGAPGLSAVDLARSLLSHFGGIRGVLNATRDSLHEIHGMGPGKSAVLIATRECCCRFLEAKLSPVKQISSPTDSQNFFLARLRYRPLVVFCCLFIDNRHWVLAFDELFRGTIDNTTVYPREVVKQALQRNAAAVILAHNHPSGVAEPSEADRLITRRINDALDLVDVRLLDHFIVGDGTCVSLANRGLL